MNRTIAKNLCRKCLAANSLNEVVSILRRYAKRSRGAWCTNLRKLANGLETGQLPFTIFTKGNSKLPFFSWSTLPEFTCPGAGDCLGWCYSFTAWRYPAALMRQLQNTIAIRDKDLRKIVAREFKALPAGVTIRLYVDGDIDSEDTLLFWCRALRARPDLSAYGYSKSWHIFDAFNAKGLKVPANYRLNLSSGSRFDSDAVLKDRLSAAEYTRGEFVAVPIGQHAKGFDRFASKDYHRDVRERARESTGVERVFSCPGQCGACLPNGQHACGSDRMQGVLIAIGEHN